MATDKKKRKKKEDDLEVVVEYVETPQAEQDRIIRRILSILIDKVDEINKKKSAK